VITAVLAVEFLTMKLLKCDRNIYFQRWKQRTRSPCF